MLGYSHKILQSPGPLLWLREAQNEPVKEICSSVEIIKELRNVRSNIMTVLF